MNNRQKLVQQQFLNNEKAVISRLEYTYDTALNEINRKIQKLEFRIGDLTEEYDWADDAEKEIIKSKIQSKIYQKQYQEQLQKQISGVLKQMRTKEFLTISDYLDVCYEDGFIGTIFDMHGQGVPMMIPLDQTKMVKAVQLDSKIKKGMYTRLGENADVLKKHIAAEVTRAVATGESFGRLAKRIEGQMVGTYKNPGGALSYSMRIARTEGHRIQTTAAMDAMEAAKDKGADIVKQWDSTLDDATRESHVAVDGEIRELDEKFSNGLMYPGDPHGEAAEVINCRCALLQRARWALDKDELKTLQDRAEFFGLDKADTFEEYKKKYLKAAEQTKTAEQSEHPVKNKFGDTIIFDEKMNNDKWHETVDYIKGLADEYETRLAAVKLGATEAAGTVDMGGLMRLSSSATNTAFHEFAHSITTENLTKLGLADDSAFWKEIGKIRTKYRKDVGDDTNRWISFYADSDNEISEFMAEALAQAKMHQMGISLPDKYGDDFTYSDQVLAIIDKYFKKG